MEKNEVIYAQVDNIEIQREKVKSNIREIQEAYIRILQKVTTNTFSNDIRNSSIEAYVQVLERMCLVMHPLIEDMNRLDDKFIKYVENMRTIDNEGVGVSHSSSEDFDNIKMENGIRKSQ